jgi:hypothetical protein
VTFGDREDDQANMEGGEETGASSRSELWKRAFSNGKIAMLMYLAIAPALS